MGKSWDSTRNYTNFGNFFIAIRLSKGITRPIEDIIQVASRLTEKDYSSRVRAKTKGELDQLAIAINTLAKSLQHQMEEIRENQQKN